MKPLRVAVIGAGVMGRFHANVYATLSQTTLIAIVDPDPSRRHEAQKVYGCTVYENLTKYNLMDPHKETVRHINEMGLAPKVKHKFYEKRDHFTVRSRVKNCELTSEEFDVEKLEYFDEHCLERHRWV